MLTMHDTKLYLISIIEMSRTCTLSPVDAEGLEFIDVTYDKSEAQANLYE